MAKFLWHGSYSERGAKALVVEGGTKRRAGVEQAVTAMGGTLEAMYFAFGDDDYYAIVDLPDNVSGPAVSPGDSAGWRGATQDGRAVDGPGLDLRSGYTSSVPIADTPSAS
jgi:hypothetical protein